MDLCHNELRRRHGRAITKRPLIKLFFRVMLEGFSSTSKHNIWGEKLCSRIRSSNRRSPGRERRCSSPTRERRPPTKIVVLRSRKSVAIQCFSDGSRHKHARLSATHFHEAAEFSRPDDDVAGHESNRQTYLSFARPSHFPIFQPSSVRAKKKPIGHYYCGGMTGRLNQSKI